VQIRHAQVGTGREELRPSAQAARADPRAAAQLRQRRRGAQQAVGERSHDPVARRCHVTLVDGITAARRESST
jgi:hypothetical protein